MRSDDVRATVDGGSDDQASSDDRLDAANVRASRSGHGWRDLRRGESRDVRSALAPVLANQAPGPLPRGRDGAPGSRRSDGGALWPLGRALGTDGPRFDAPVANEGYRWFYLDAVSDDRASSVVVIALLGNPFSPRYARAR